MAKIAKTGDRKKVMDTTKSTDCPKCKKPTRIVKRVKDRERAFLAAFTFPVPRATSTKNFKRKLSVDPPRKPGRRAGLFDDKEERPFDVAEPDGASTGRGLKTGGGTGEPLFWYLKEME